MVRLNLSLNGLRNRKEIFNLLYKQGHLSEKFKEADKFKASKTCKNAIKTSKVKVVINFKQF